MNDKTMGDYYDVSPEELGETQDMLDRMKDCTCRLKTGYIDRDSDAVRCLTCDGIIKTLEQLKMHDIKSLDELLEGQSE